MKQQSRLLLLLLGLSALAQADIAATTQDIRAFVLPENTLTLRASYLRTNNAIDILNLNEKAETGDIYSGLDDSAGLDLSLGYGVGQFYTLYYNFEARNIHYAGAKVKNRKNELYARVNFYDTPHNSFDDFSMDIGLIHNSADDFNHLSNLSDNSFYLRLLLGSRFNTALLNFYTGFKYSAINTTLQQANHDRDERTLLLGTSFTKEFHDYILDANYAYMRMVGRGSRLSENKSNHILELTLSRIIKKDFIIFMGGEIMLNQFNGLIPYLYNTQTQSAFDKTYAGAKIGFVYNFSLEN